MDAFEPMRDFFHPRAAKNLNERAGRVHLVNRRQESSRDNFVFPGTTYFDDIEVGGQRVGDVIYSLNPLLDRVYIHRIDIDPTHQKQGIGLGVLWHLWLKHQVPIVPISQYGKSGGFWSLARCRFAAAGALIEPELRLCELYDAKQRWQHLVPEPDPERLIRELRASADWPAIEASMKASAPS
ncbi:N-acetyltransferase [Pseudomonas fluorescens]|uniref:Uncharacterized protein n=1 Tax=Pseudomonas fluorescens TaxID=294 RepID=A0A5E7PB55_PSEFL|nr:N-acetyltransferase [Pseudomonas fluorescens]VVP44663.1 hypothetical protein PS880_05031 [Pseudomonas fluorescens]